MRLTRTHSTLLSVTSLCAAMALALAACGGNSSPDAGGTTGGDSGGPIGGGPSDAPGGGPGNPVVAVPEPSALAGVWEGTTNQGHPVSFAVSPDGRIIDLLGTFTTTGPQCSSTASLHLNDPNMKVVSGKFQGASQVADGDALKSADVAATFESDSKVSGTIAASGHCGDSGPLPWTAKKGPSATAPSLFPLGSSVNLESFGDTSYVVTDGRRLQIGTSSPSFTATVALNATGNGGNATFTDTGRYGDLRLNIVDIAVPFIRPAPGAVAFVDDPADTSGITYRILDPQLMGFRYQTPARVSVELGGSFAGSISHHGSVSTTARPTVPSSGAVNYSTGKFFGTLAESTADSVPVIADFAIRIDYATGQVTAKLSNILAGANVLTSSATGKPLPAYEMTIEKTVTINVGGHFVGINADNATLSAYPFGPAAEEIGGDASFTPKAGVKLSGQFGARQ